MFIVDFLEPIQIQEPDHQHALMSFAAGEGLAYSIGQQDPVRQSGQRVVVRVVFELVLKTLLRADVVKCADVSCVNRNKGELCPDSMSKRVNKPKQGFVTRVLGAGALQSFAEGGSVIRQEMSFKRMACHLREGNTRQERPRRIQENDPALPVELKHDIRHQLETSTHAPIALSQRLHQLVGGRNLNVVEKGVSSH